MKKRRKFKGVKFGRKGWGVRSRKQLELHEAKVILTHVELMELGVFTAADLIRTKPNRYNPPYLNSALKRMADRGLLEKVRWSSGRFRRKHYKLTEITVREEKAA